MIKVIFTDTKDNETQLVQEYRGVLKEDSMARMQFNCDINHCQAYFIGKLREEIKREDKCKRKSVQ